MIRAEVRVMLKTGVLDPQGQATRKALANLGFGDVDTVRQGKLIVLDLNTDDPAAAEAEARAMASKLLANPVIEDFSVELLDA
jgi:phosphoribosylformylglycinamidine synthase PurS subunit